jgi:anti-sigma regulatory factor (Ser/Thr protein kinase)
MPTELEASFPATASGMVAALQTIEHSAGAWNLGADLAMRLCIIVEELFSNTIKYGYGRECDHPVRLWLLPEPVPTLIYEDDAAPFDPTAWQHEIEELLPHERPEGKAGIKMVLGLSVSAVYRPRDGGNRLVITLG